MKKLLCIIAILFQFSVTSSAKTEYKDVPIEIKTLQKSNVFDTVYVIQTKDIIYIFDKNKQYVEAVHKSAEDTLGFSLCMVLIVTLIIIIFLL